jgi:aminopeptidase
MQLEVLMPEREIFVPDAAEVHPRVHDHLIEPIVEAMVTISGKVRPEDTVLVYYDRGGAQLARAVARRSAQAGARVIYYQRDLALDAILASELSERDARRSSGFLDLMTQEADVVFVVRYATEEQAMAAVPRGRLDLWNQVRQPIQMEYRVNHTRWVLIYWPTKAEAEADGLEYLDYVDLFLRACDQPWPEIHAAQDVLAGILDRGQILEIHANENDDDALQTHLTMDIGPMRFANSTIDHNFPGSEVFASPVKTSVQGQLFARGVYEYQGRRMRDIHLVVRDGRIVEATASAGQDELNAILNTDEGARYFGEVAFGTNPGLRRRLLNPLLNEKVGGSFHITPGRAYSLATYNGRPVQLDNGNRSAIHWDIAIPMLPQFGGGRVVVDGTVIQQDGRFIPSDLEVLNAGL